MMRPNDPRIRQNLNRLGNTLEAASATAQSYLYSASQRASPYITPCLASLSTCLEASCQPCFTARDEHFRRRGHLHHGTRRDARGRDGVGGFDFYDDWEREEVEWGNDELERLLSGGEEEPGPLGGKKQPSGMKKGMSYGSRLVGGGGRAPGETERRGAFGGGRSECRAAEQHVWVFGELAVEDWREGERAV